MFLHSANSCGLWWLSHGCLCGKTAGIHWPFRTIKKWPFRSDWTQTDNLALLLSVFLLNSLFACAYLLILLAQIFDNFLFFKFGGVPFVCTHDYLWNTRPGTNGHAKDMFEINYGIKLSDVYISLDELQSVASFNSLFSMIDDFLSLVIMMIQY